MSRVAMPWPPAPLDAERFRAPPREYGILPFWFLNGELDPDEMRRQLRELREKGMPGVILHARYGLETQYIGPTYLDRIRLAVEEAEKLDLRTWIYDEMNWPSGTADQRVLRERPDLAQRYLECVNFVEKGPWFAYLTGEDSRYLDFERSTPVAAFALGAEGEVVDLTPNLSFEKVIPWQVPPGRWRLLYLVEKRAEYYIDALDPESTAEFLRVGYEPYAAALDGNLPAQTVGFYTDEPAMHYFLSGGDDPIVPWTKDMFRRFRERNGYELRPRLADLFFDVSPDSARVRYDFYRTLTAFYSDAYYRQIAEWCHARGVLFTGHLLYEEWLRKMIRVEGDVFKHYVHLDVVGVDHLYPIIGDRDRPEQHVAIKVGSSAAHQLGSERLLCESFGGLFMDATMERMKWITDWEYVLGVNLLNPHGFHYTLEGPRKRDWPPSMFYHYPWWGYYGEFSAYVSRLSYLLTGGRHVAKAAVLWPINAMFATYTPQRSTPLHERMERDFNVLTDLLLRLHHDFDYLDEETLAQAELEDGTLRVADETHELLVLPPLTHVKLETLERIERFVAAGGRVLATVFLPDRAFDGGGLVDVSDRIEALFGVSPRESQRRLAEATELELVERDHPGGGRTVFVRTHALARPLPRRLERRLASVTRREREALALASGWPWFAADENPIVRESGRHWFLADDGGREDVTDELAEERREVADAVGKGIAALIEPDVVIGNDEIFCLHRVKDGRDLYFFVNSTSEAQEAEVSLEGEVEPLLWDPSTGAERAIAPWRHDGGRTTFRLSLPPVGSVFVLTRPAGAWSVARADGLVVEAVEDGRVVAFGRVGEAELVLVREGREERVHASAGPCPAELVLDGEWEFVAEDPNALVVRRWLTTVEEAGALPEVYAAPTADTGHWLTLVPGAWSYQQPTEPQAPYPIPVWYRAEVHADHAPGRLELIVDGFAGSDWRLYVNGVEVTELARPSELDSQMKAVDIRAHVREGRNVVALRLTLEQPTGGLLDLLKLVGDFSVATGDRIAAPRAALAPADWSGQGYPYYSGRGLYRRQVQVPGEFAGRRVFVEADAGDDALEVLVNGASAGVRLWQPYSVDVTGHLRPGENLLELRIANTPANLLDGVRRRSGLDGPPRLVPYNRFELPLPS